MGKIYFLMSLLVILAIPDMWTFVPYSQAIIYPFPLNKDQGITLATWTWIGCMKLTTLIFGHILWMEVPKYRPEIKVFFFLSIGYLLDYLLNYNANFGTYHKIPLAYTTAMLLGFSLLIIFNLYKLLRNG